MRLRTLHEADTQQSARNLLTDYDDTLLAMAEVEGLDYFGRYDDNGAIAFINSQDRDSDVTAPRVLKQVIGIRKRHGRKADEPSQTHMPIGTIYGNGGYNRWFVYIDGTVKFSSGHSGSRHATARARELGFEVV